MKWVFFLMDNVLHHCHCRSSANVTQSTLFQKAYKTIMSLILSLQPRRETMMSSEGGVYVLKYFCCRHNVAAGKKNLAECIWEMVLLIIENEFFVRKSNNIQMITCCFALSKAYFIWICRFKCKSLFKGLSIHIIKCSGNTGWNIYHV